MQEADPEDGEIEWLEYILRKEGKKVASMGGKGGDEEVELDDGLDGMSCLGLQVRSTFALTSSFYLCFTPSITFASTAQTSPLQSAHDPVPQHWPEQSADQ